MEVTHNCISVAVFVLLQLRLYQHSHCNSFLFSELQVKIGLVLILTRFHFLVQTIVSIARESVQLELSVSLHVYPEEL